MKLSACVIVKNEVANLPRWLSCMSKVADEMIVVDTGSVDDTVQLARAAGARVYHFEWCNDFAAAKNYAIEQAVGDWILFLDADEYFTDATLKRLRKDIEHYNRDKQAGLIWCRLINIDKDRNNKVVDTMMQARVFRRLDSIRYRGAVHEQLGNSKGNLRMLVNNDWQIYHTGYSASNFRQKAERNLAMLKEREKVAKTQRERDNLAVYFMDAYNSLGNYEKAIQYARQGLAGKFRIVGMEGHFYDVIFSAMQQLGKSRQEQLDLLDEAMEHHPEEICFVMEKGYVLWQAKDYLSAKVYLEKGLAMRQDFEAKLAQGQLLTDSSLRLLPYVYHALGDIAYKRGNKAQAAELFLQGIMVYKYAGELLAGLYNCLRDGDTVEIIQLINSLYDRTQDAGFILSVLSGRAVKELLLYYASAIAGEDSLLEKYFLSGRYDAAAVVAADRIRNISRLLISRQIEDSIWGEEHEGSSVNYRQNVLPVILGSRFLPMLDLKPHLNTLEGRSVQRTLSRKHISPKDGQYVIMK